MKSPSVGKPKRSMCGGSSAARRKLIVAALVCLAVAGRTEAQTDLQTEWPKWESRRITLPSYQYAIGKTNPNRGEGTIGRNYFFGLTSPDPEVRRILFFNELVHLTGASVTGERTIEYGKGTYGLVARGEYQRAIPDLVYVLDHWLNHPEALQLISIIALMTEQTTLAVERFEAALERYPEYGMTYYQYARYLAAAGMAAQAKEVADRGRAADPDFLPLRELFSRAAAAPGTSK